MSPDSSDDDFSKLLKQGWIAGYAPWFSNVWIAPAKCKTKEKASHLLHLLRSIQDGQLTEMRRLLPRIDPNLHLAVEGQRTESLLEWAAEKAPDSECIRLLVAAGASLNAPTLVYKLVTAGRMDLLPELLQAGADPNAGPDDQNALIAACWSNAKAVRVLLDAGARTDVTTTVWITNKQSVSKVTPLMVASYAGTVHIVKLLLKAGADAKAMDVARNTALAWAKISRAKAKAAKIIPLLEQAGATLGAQSGRMPAPVDFSERAKRPEFQEAISLAKALTKSPAKSVPLADGPLRGARSFRILNAESAVTQLDEIRPKAAALGALAFLSVKLFETPVPYLVLVPTTDYREAIIAFETPEGQSIDSYDLIAWLTELEKTQPFIMTHLAPDLIRARFTTPLQDAARLAKAIRRICPDVVNASVSNIARQLQESRELYLWWD
jgi:hypothetical protein